MITLDVNLDDLIAAVREIVAEDPKFVYKTIPVPYSSSCFYERNGKPSCLIGRALFKIGVSIETLAEMDKDHPEQADGTAITSYFPNNADDRVRWLEIVQDRQDMEYEYASCVEYADQWLENAS